MWYNVNTKRKQVRRWTGKKLMSTKQELTKVDRETLMNVVRNAGLDVKEQSAYFKCTFGESPAKIYVAKSAKVSRVDLSGFTLQRPGIRQITAQEAKELRRGKVQAELDFTQDEATLVEALEKACEALKLVEPAPKKEKVKAKTAETTTETEPVETAGANDDDNVTEGEDSTDEEPTEDEAMRAARIAAIKASAKKRADEAETAAAQQ